jgi:uncharacterized DUF497 family protein
MRFKFDRRKSAAIRADRRRGIGFEQAAGLWLGRHLIDQRSELPEQWRAIGWVDGRMFTVIYEDRHDEEGEFIHLVTLWPSTKEERRAYEKGGWQEHTD